MPFIGGWRPMRTAPRQRRGDAWNCAGEGPRIPFQTSRTSGPDGHASYSAVRRFSPRGVMGLTLLFGRRLRTCSGACRSGATVPLGRPENAARTRCQILEKLRRADRGITGGIAGTGADWGSNITSRRYPKASISSRLRTVSFPFSALCRRNQKIQNSQVCSPPFHCQHGTLCKLHDLFGHRPQ